MRLFVRRFFRLLCLLPGSVLLPAPTPLLPPDGLIDFHLQQPGPDSAHRTVVPVNGQAFTQAVRVETTGVPPQPYLIQLGHPTTGPVAVGDVITGEVWLRRVGPAGGNVATEIVFEQAGPPYTQSFTRVVGDDTGNWTRHRFAFVAVAPYPAAGAQVNLRLGYSAQAIELGGLVLTNNAQSAPLASFPNDFSYAGRAPDARWRTNALAAIERHRKVPLNIEVQDAAGFPVPTAEIEVIETRSAFAFGSAVVASRLLGGGPDDQRYQGVVTNWFNTVVFENDLKWPTYEANPSPAEQAVDWLRARGIAVRGHNLIWPGTNQPAFLPSDVPGLFGDPARLRTRINARFTQVLGRFQGRIADWDVINEPLHERAIEGVLGRPELAEWFGLAHQSDPAATLYLNEYENLEAVTDDGTVRLRALADDLRQRGAPLDALGLQAHFNGYLTPPTQLLARLDRLSGVQPAGANFPLRITEFDVNTTDETLQADYTRDLLTVAFSHPAVTGVLTWGFWERQHWLPRAALFRSDWEPKPAALVWSNLTQHTWITRTNLRTSVSGKAVVRAYKGDYQVRVRTPAGNRDFSAVVLADTRLRAVVPIVPPELTVTTGDSFEYRWPAYATGYVLESSERIDRPGWQPIEVIPVFSMQGWRVQLSPPDTTRYYRLHRSP